MFKHGKLSRALALTVPAVASLMLAVSASASPAPTVSFGSSNDGASAGWTSGKGSPIDLTLGTTSGSFAYVKLHHEHGAAVSELSAPSFTTSSYAAGSPRFFVTLSDGHSLWGYPPQSGLNGSDFAWAIDNGNTYQSWAGVQAAEGGATVKDAYVIADADQTAGTVDEITGLTFGDIDFN
jgi:hypothetical protein